MYDVWIQNNVVLFELIWDLSYFSEVYREFRIFLLQISMHTIQVMTKRLKYRAAIFFSVRECLTLSSLIVFLLLQIENISEDQRFEVRNCNLFFFSRMIKIRLVWHLFFHHRIIFFLIRECITSSHWFFSFFANRKHKRRSTLRSSKLQFSFLYTNDRDQIRLLFFFHFVKYLVIVSHILYKSRT